MKAIVRHSALILFLLVLGSACRSQGELKAGNTSSANAAPANTATQNTASSSNQGEAAKPADAPPSSSASASLATPTDAYKAGYAARRDKDIAGLKRVLSKDALQFLSEVGKEEKKTLDDQLKALAERPQAPTAEARDEKITGNTATLEYLNERGGWSTMHLIKEGEDWKIDLPKAQ